MMVLLRFFAGDGWQDAGLRLNLRQSRSWYLFSLLYMPAGILLVFGAGLASGMTTSELDFKTATAALAAGYFMQFIPRTLFSMFEEWGWRGYLEGRLAALDVPDVKRHLLVGLIWAIWHYPLILFTNYTDIHPAIFLPMFTLGILALSVVYGQMRKRSQTVWTAVLLHGSGNALAWAIISNKSFVFNDKILFYVGPESAMTMALLILTAGIMLYMRAKSPEKPIC